jgi:hypothetical protein
MTRPFATITPLKYGMSLALLRVQRRQAGPNAHQLRAMIITSLPGRLLGPEGNIMRDGHRNPASHNQRLGQDGQTISSESRNGQGVCRIAIWVIKHSASFAFSLLRSLTVPARFRNCRTGKARP